MAPTPRGSATYKKQNGTLSLSPNHKVLSWTPITPAGSKPGLEILVSAITNLQQTPVTNPKVMLKVFAKPPQQPQVPPETHVFGFTAPSNPRAEADAIKDALSKIISAAKAGGSDGLLAGSAPNGDAGGATSAGMAIASAIASTSTHPHSSGDSSTYSDAALLSNITLQQSLLSSSPSLSRTFMEALKTKPQQISSSQFTSQFWSSRLPLLRAHTIEKQQTRGQYNVLASIKPVTVDSVLKLSVSKEQISLIFSQHSLVKRVYDENVPRPMKEEEFWTRFFQSRLFKKLKGEKITDADATDNVLDRYLNIDEEAEKAERARNFLGKHVPHIIDVEGNEENHSQRKGNQPDITMRAKGMPIIRTINDLSEKIMAGVTPNDVDPSTPIGMDEETYNQLALRDLQAEERERRNELKVRDGRDLFFSESAQQTQGGAEEERSLEMKTYAKQDLRQVLDGLNTTLMQATESQFDLAENIGVDPDSEESEDEGDDDGNAQDKSTAITHVGSTSARSAATKQIFAAIATQRSTLPSSSSTSDPNTGTSPSTNTYGLSQEIYSRLLLTHATTTEFLSHFYTTFLSGDPSLAPQLADLALTLERALERIDAVADAAEEERQKEVQEMKAKIRAWEERSGKKRRWEEGSVGGGKVVVRRLFEGTTNCVRGGLAEYEKAVREAQEEERLAGK